MDEYTPIQDLETLVTERVESDFSLTHDGCKNWIEYFNTHNHTLLFGKSDPRTLERATLKSIVRHIKQQLI